MPLAEPKRLRLCTFATPHRRRIVMIAGQPAQGNVGLRDLLAKTRIRRLAAVLGKIAGRDNGVG